MEIVSVYAFGIVQAFLQLLFSDRFLNNKSSLKFNIVSAVVVAIIANALLINGVLISLFMIALIFLKQVFVMKSDKKSALVSAVTASVVMWLIFGICDSAESALLSFIYERTGILPNSWVSVVGNIIPFVITFFCYGMISKNITKIRFSAENCVVSIMPLILLFAVDVFIGNTLYGNVISTEQMPSPNIHLCVFAARLLCFASVICILYSYNKLIAAQLSGREYELHKQYSVQMKKMYDNTVSFRHDIKNHLNTVRGLIAKGEYNAAQDYINELCDKRQELSFRFSTGRAVADILLEEKLQGINADCKLKIPDNCSLSDTDLCVILSNALDNAVRAYSENGGEITITSKKKANMLLIEIENNFDGKPFEESTGISNIRKAAVANGGNIIIRTADMRFYLGVIVCISSQQ